jgi:DNA repair exonuclease SbcCD ATPase subunit
MSQQIDSFCEKLRGKLNEMDDRLQQLKASAKADSEKARQDLHSQTEKLRASLDADRASIEAAKTRMKDWAAGRKATFDDKVAQWKAQRKQEQLNRRAEAAEGYASDAFDVAVAAVDDAYEAAIEAIIARGDADEVSPVKLSA